MKITRCPALSRLPRKKKDRAEAVGEKLKMLYPQASCALEFEGSPFRLLVMARLSAQCTDKRVNEVSGPLFQRYPDVYSMAQAELSELEALIRPCGLYRSKARQILEMCQILVRDFNGAVPQKKELLLSLPGVGEKIANLMLGDVFGDPHIVADTHCIRLAGRLALTDAVEPGKVTRELEKIIPKAEQSDFCHRIICLGRQWCRAQNPHCQDCPFMK